MALGAPHEMQQQTKIASQHYLICNKYNLHAMYTQKHSECVTQPQYIGQACTTVRKAIQQHVVEHAERDKAL